MSTDEDILDVTLSHWWQATITEQSAYWFCRYCGKNIDYCKSIDLPYKESCPIKKKQDYLTRIKGLGGLQYNIELVDLFAVSLAQGMSWPTYEQAQTARRCYEIADVLLTAKAERDRKLSQASQVEPVSEKPSASDSEPPESSA